MRPLTADAVSAGARAKPRRALSLLCALSVVLALALVLFQGMAHASGAVWSFQPALAPPPPPGVAPAPDPVPLGTVGQISFWSPNRGLLITGGTEVAGGVVPAGVYAYDGVSWHQLASVCGGAKGRIAWAGPDEFWTIADQRAGQITSGGENERELEALSLCHFVGDQIVGSYAVPIGEPGSYLQMDAAACLSPGDCWFAGRDGQPPNSGSFHLHWNGSEVSAYYDPSDHAVASIVDFGGRLYEGLAIGEGDSYLPSEEPEHPPVVRTIAAQTSLCSSTGEQSAFCDVFLFSEGRQLPEYPARSLPDALAGFELATDGGPLGAGATQLWAGANPAPEAPEGSALAKLTLLRDSGGDWTQLAPSPSGSSSLPSGVTLSGSSFELRSNSKKEQGFESIAPMPGGESAWLSLDDGTAGATVALLEASGKLAATATLPEARENVGFRGTAGPIACPATDDCWMATDESGSTSGGWLFHYTDGASLAPNTDPLFDGEDGVIAYRPPDSGVPAVYPDGFAEDDSLANQQPAPEPAKPAETAPSKSAKPKKAKPLVTHMKSRFVHGRTLLITFTLTARAHVQLVARRRQRIVARTRAQSLRPGRHTLSLSLDPAAWPTKLQFRAKPLGAPAPSSGPGTTESESGDTVVT